MAHKILLADDHSMLLIGLITQIEAIGYRDIQSVKSCSQLLKELQRQKYTHLILDIGLSDGSSIEILQTIRNLYPDLNIMIFSAKPASAYERASRKYNITHYLSKEGDRSDTIQGIRRFFNGEPMLSSADTDMSNPFSKLTSRESEVLPYLLQGKGTFEIGSILGLAPSTITTYKRVIFDKTETKNIAELVTLATAYGMM